jgi:cytochrome c-type biogenesis protein CcmH/NrfG
LAQCLSHDAPLRSQAFDRINQALKIVGPRADLLATKGMIYFYADNSKEGIDLLQTAASTIHSSPKHQFYYALMLTRIDALDQARQVWRSLSLDELAPSLDVDERNRLTELQQILSVP